MDCALVFQSVLTKGLRPLDPRPAGGRFACVLEFTQSISSLIHAKNIGKREIKQSMKNQEHTFV